MEPDVIVDVPVLFRAKVILPHGRVEKDVTVLGSHPFALRQFTDEEAPVVAKAVVKRVEGKGGSRREIGTEIAYRDVGGNLMRPLCLEQEWLDEVLSPKAMLAASSLQDFFSLMATRLGEGREAGVLLKDIYPCHDRDSRSYGRDSVLLDERYPENEFVHRKWISDDRDEIVGLMQAKLDQLAVIDGVVYRPSSGPAWYVHYDRDSREKGMAVRVVPESQRLEGWPSVSEVDDLDLKGDWNLTYPAFALESAQMNAYALAMEDRFRYEIPVTYSGAVEGGIGVIGQHCAFAMERHPLEPFLLDLADDGLLEMRGVLLDVPTETIHVFAEVRDAVRASRRGECIDVPRMLDQLEHLHAAWEKAMNEGYRGKDEEYMCLRVLTDLRQNFERPEAFRR
jgi:hypothetical protein